jgi:hypothetical protein
VNHKTRLRPDDTVTLLEAVEFAAADPDLEPLDPQQPGTIRSSAEAATGEDSATRGLKERRPPGRR